MGGGQANREAQEQEGLHDKMIQGAKRSSKEGVKKGNKRGRERKEKEARQMGARMKEKRGGSRPAPTKEGFTDKKIKPSGILCRSRCGVVAFQRKTQTTRISYRNTGEEDVFNNWIMRWRRFNNHLFKEKRN